MLTICIIEDNKTLQLIYKNQLERDGYTVLAGSTAGEGYKLLQLNKVDLLLLDVLLPDKNGLQLLEELRRDVRYVKLPVLVMTTLPEEVAYEKGKALEIYGYIKKDQFTPEQLSQRVKITLSEVYPNQNPV